MVEPYVIASVVYGALFALMAIGLTWTYMTTKVPNFAYGSFVTIGVYTSYTLFKVNGMSPYLSSVVAYAVAALASALMYLGVLRPLARRGSSLVSLMIATFGIDIGFTGIFGIYTDYLIGRYHLIDTKQFFQLQADFAVWGVQGIVYVAPLILALVGVGIFLLFTRTKFGVAMRASVENPPLARVLGINVERVYVVSWMLAGGFAGLAGALYVLWLPGGTSTGSDLIVEIFAASILGGLSSIFGAILGGLVIGGGEILGTTFLGLGIGEVGTGLVALLFAMTGTALWRKKKARMKILGVLALAVMVYFFADMAFGLPVDFVVPELVTGYGASAIQYQKAIPLIIMVISLLVLPKGLVSVNARGLLRKEKKS